MTAAQSVRISAPPPEVLAAFGAAGQLVKLTGGFHARAWRCGDIGLKPLDIPAESLAWHADLLARLDGRDDFRVAPLLRTSEGELTKDGWVAWRFEPGHHPERAWDAVITTGRAFHAVVAAEPRPGFLDRRDDWWSTGDRVAFGELSPEAFTEVPLLHRILPRLDPVTEPSQLVHGDLTANVLVHDHLPPLVIDLSAYWRPPSFADAVVVVDALTWEGADAQLVAAHPEIGTGYLLRALVYRLVTHHLGSDGNFLPADLARYERVLDELDAVRAR